MLAMQNVLDYMNGQQMQIVPAPVQPLIVPPPLPHHLTTGVPPWVGPPPALAVVPALPAVPVGPGAAAAADDGAGPGVAAAPADDV